MKQKVKEIKLIKKFTVENWLIILGSSIMFFSWIAEKNFHSQWQSEKERLKNSQFLIEIRENSKANYEIALISEIQKEKSDEFLIANYQCRLSRIYMDLLSWSDGRVSTDIDKYNQLLESKYKVDEQNRESLLNGNYQIINNNFNNIVNVHKEVFASLDNEFINKVNEANDNLRVWTNRFIILYILGSICLGASYIIRLHNKSNKINCC